MRLENLKQDFPKMPEEMREMVEREVQKQVSIAARTGRKRTHRIGNSLVAALAAVLLLGTTVFAGVIYQIRSESVGKYGIRIQTKETETEENSVEQIQNIPAIKMEVSYLPDGMVEAEEGKYCYQNAMYKGGVSVLFYSMDTKDAKFDMLTKNVAKNELIKVGAYDGVYLELLGGSEEELSFHQRIYVAYTDLHCVMEMFVASDVSKAEALKIAEGIHLSIAAEGETEGIIRDYKWSDYIASKEEEGIVLESNLVLTKAELNNTHVIGEAFVMNTEEDDQLELGQVEAMVADVKIFDNISPLDLSVMDSNEKEEIAKEIDLDGKLLPTQIRYIKFGDGIDTTDEIVECRDVPQKLVYATVEYTNTGSKELSEVLFMGSLVKIMEEGNQVKIYAGEKPENNSVWDDAQIIGAAGYQEMWYYDIHGGERGNNYITSLKPGETATVHMAWLVPEEELKYLYLNLDTFGGAYEFNEHSLAIGYVDIRQ